MCLVRLRLLRSSVSCRPAPGRPRSGSRCFSVGLRGRRSRSPPFASAPYASLRTCRAYSRAPFRSLAPASQTKRVIRYNCFSTKITVPAHAGRILASSGFENSMMKVGCQALFFLPCFMGGIVFDFLFRLLVVACFLGRRSPPPSFSVSRGACSGVAPPFACRLLPPRAAFQSNHERCGASAACVSACGFAVAAAGLLPRSGKRFGFVGRARARSSGAAPRACCLSSAPVLPFAVCRAVIVRRRQYLTRAPTVVLTAARAEVPTGGRKERTWIIGFTKNRRGDGQRKKKT